MSSAAALIGIANGVLYAFHGPWTYTRTFHDAVMQLVDKSAGPIALQWGLFVAVVAGAVISAWQKGAFRLDWQPSSLWLQSLVGGLMMGFGAAMTPGGNGALILQSMPQLSPHAVPALLAMSVGIVMVLVVMRVVQGVSLQVDCQGDICQTKWMLAPRV